MKKEMICCDCCEEILREGGIRLVAKAREEEPIDVCAECLGDLLIYYSKTTGRNLLTAEITEEALSVLRESDDEDEAIQSDGHDPAEIRPIAG